MLLTKNEGVSEQKESEMKGESEVGTDSNDESEKPQIIQQEPVKIKVDRTNMDTTYIKMKIIILKRDQWSRVI